MPVDNFEETMRDDKRLRSDLTCRTCGATPAQRGDVVSAAAVAYTCCRCLAFGRPAAAVKGAGISLQPPHPSATAEAQKIGEFHDSKSGTAAPLAKYRRRCGRAPLPPEARRQHDRERKRRLRAQSTRS